MICRCLLEFRPNESVILRIASKVYSYPKLTPCNSRRYYHLNNQSFTVNPVLPMKSSLRGKNLDHFPLQVWSRKQYSSQIRPRSATSNLWSVNIEAEFRDNKRI